MLAVACILVGLFSVFMLTRRTWDKTERRDSVIGSQLSPRLPSREEAP